MKYGFIVAFSLEVVERQLHNPNLIRNEIFDRLSIPVENRKGIQFHHWIDESNDLCFFKFRTTDPLPGFPLVQEGEPYQRISLPPRE